MDPRVLIPRPDTEKLVELALEHIDGDTEQVLDLCTGSGAIALAIASEHPKLKLTATDISPEAIVLAQENSAHLDLSNVQFQVSNLFEDLSGTFTMILSNPPYIPSSGCRELMPDVRDYEPLLALDGGSDGLDFYRKIIDQSPHYLAQDGHLFLEIGYDQADGVKDIIEKRAGLMWIHCHQDLAGKDRVVHAQRTQDTTAS